MALIDNMAMLNKMAMLGAAIMPKNSSVAPTGSRAEQHVAEIFQSQGWAVEMQSAVSPNAHLVIGLGAERFIVEVKALSESRPDRVLPLLSMAILQAREAAERSSGASPLAVIWVPEASPSLVNHVQAFAQRFANDTAVGIVSARGERYFSAEAFQPLNHLPEETRRARLPRPAPTINLFSDLNQWMLKLLLAWELPEGLLNAPRRRFRSGSELAECAQVSAMSASRFLQQLRNEGYLSDSSVHLKLVRCEELFSRWSAAAMRPSSEIPCRFLLRLPADQQIRSLLSKHTDDACLGLFAAADALDIGHVSGVPPYIYVNKAPDLEAPAWAGLMAFPSERPDVILRQTAFPQSTFRAAVNQDGVLVADIFQVWLDVKSHPTRGAEQAQLIYDKYLRPLTGS
ncbi:RpiR family transcriptional regulator [Comamonas sp.]|uniref:RpiR family transcriptional regulator n=1 Tax=Comamonas sp. TaxID=34028 RepID=UPI002899DE9C|nr:RpiR family transcriptional regulator [Comamonas sp.]